MFDLHTCPACFSLPSIRSIYGRSVLSCLALPAVAHNLAWFITAVVGIILSLSLSRYRDILDRHGIAAGCEPS